MTRTSGKSIFQILPKKLKFENILQDKLNTVRIPIPEKSGSQMLQILIGSETRQVSGI